MPSSRTSPSAADRPADSGRTVETLMHLRAAGVSLLVETTDGRSPAVVHWGADLGPLDADSAAAITAATVPTAVSNAIDVPLRPAILPQLADGWAGRPGISGSRADGGFFSPRLRVRSVQVDGVVIGTSPDGADGASCSFHETGPASVHYEMTDETVGIRVDLEVELLATGLVRMRARLTNTGADAYHLEQLSLTLPLPLDADELLDFAGRWGKERTPQRRELKVGTHLRENRRGRTGADSAYLLHAGARGFGFSHGEIRALHTAFSGDHVHYAEKLWTGDQVLGGGELLLPGEGILAPGASYTSPQVYGAYGVGLDDVAHRFHRQLRSRPQHVSVDRPVTLNVWEAVYFDHDLDRLRDLADRAAALGVERYVLDDGWFGERRNDHAGLGDWVVSKQVWPDGLGPLIDHVKDRGMQFGLWFEPEMVSEDSDLARAHPEWIMGPAPDRLPLRSRHQQVLNLTIPGAFEHVLSQMTAVLEAYDISYLKWDHNRDLIEAATRATGAAATHEQTLACYRLMDTLKERFPGLEIESCGSGGARVDLEVLERTDRVWVSDCIDPLERQQMNRWTAQLIPLELMGSHIASGASHSTGRLHSLAFRAGTALFGHLGIEWDLREASAADEDALRAWISLYKRVRPLLFTGDLVRADRADDSLWISGVVDAGRSHGLFQIVAMDRSDVSPRGRLLLPGLDPERHYRVRTHRIGAPPTGLRTPAWMTPEDGVVLPGSAPAVSGLAAPQLDPEQLILLEVEAVESPSDEGSS